MKRLLVLTLILLTVTLAGVLQVSAIHHEIMENIALSEEYKHVYPETMSFDILMHYPF
jgi:choline-glycine betaine transporter